MFKRFHQRFCQSIFSAQMLLWGEWRASPTCGHNNNITLTSLMVLWSQPGLWCPTGADNGLRLFSDVDLLLFGSVRSSGNANVCLPFTSTQTSSKSSSQSSFSSFLTICILQAVLSSPSHTSSDRRSIKYFVLFQITSRGIQSQNTKLCSIPASAAQAPAHTDWSLVCLCLF